MHLVLPLLSSSLANTKTGQASGQKSHACLRWRKRARSSLRHLARQSWGQLRTLVPRLPKARFSQAHGLSCECSLFAQNHAVKALAAHLPTLALQRLSVTEPTCSASTLAPSCLWRFRCTDPWGLSSFVKHHQSTVSHMASTQNISLGKAASPNWALQGTPPPAHASATPSGRP
jgi:hypothetical protein